MQNSECLEIAKTSTNRLRPVACETSTKKTDRKTRVQAASRFGFSGVYAEGSNWADWLQLFLLTDVRFFCALFHPRLRAPPKFLFGLDLSIDFCLAKFLPYIFITHHAVVGEIWKALPCSAFSLIFVFLEFEVVNQFSYKTGVDTQNVVRLRSWSCGGFYPHPLCYSGSRIVASAWVLLFLSLLSSGN